MAKIDWDTVSSFIEGIGSTDKVITFPKVQEQVKVTNKGNVDVIYTIGTKSGTLAPSDMVVVNENLTSFTVRASSGSSEIYVRASEAGTEKEEIPSDIPADIAVHLNDLSTQMAQIVTNVDKFGAKGDGTTDDTTIIQNAINSVKATGGTIQFTSGKTYKITKPLVVYDNTTIFAYGATIKLMAHEQHFMVNECFLDTTIRTRNKNITILGGTFDASTYSGTALKNLRCIFWHVDNLTIKDGIFLSSSGKYMIAIADTTNVNIDNLDFNSSSDGIHLMGKNYNTTITNISGTCGDDMVALTTQDYAGYVFDEGDINDLKIENVSGSNGTRIILLGNTKYTIKNVSMKNIRQLGTGDIISVGDGGVSDTTILVDNVTINNAYADNTTSRIILKHRHMGTFKFENIQNQIYFGRENTGVCEIDNFIVNNCSGYIWADTVVTRMTNVSIENVTNRVWLANAENVMIKNMRLSYTNYLIYLYGNSTKVSIENSILQSTAAGDDPVIAFAGIIGDITFNSCKITGGGVNQCILLDGRSFGTAYYCSRIKFFNSEIGNHKLLYRSMYNGTDVNTEMILANTLITSTNRIIENLANYNLTFKYSNVTITTNVNELFRFTTGKKLFVYGNGWSGGTTSNVTLTGTLTAESYALDFPANAALLSKVAKGACYNTNAALSCGVGYVISDGTNWKNLFSGLTY